MTRCYIFKDGMDIRIERLAQRLYDEADPWDIEDDTYEQIVDCLENDPLSVVEYLMDKYVEE